MERTPLRPRPTTRAYNRVLAVIDEGGRKLPLKDALFVDEYLVDYNGARAAKAAGIKPEGAAYWASAKLREPNVLAEINRKQVLSREKLQLRREDLMQIWYDLAYADVRELIPLKVKCCRHCHGEGHQYQYTQIELENLYQQHRSKHRNSAHEPPPMDTKGGDGFDQRRPPYSTECGHDHDCPECNGLGVMTPEPLDLTKVSRGAQHLIGGIKIDRYGNTEIKFNDRLKAVEKLEQYLGFIKPKRGLWVLDFDQMDDDQLDALLLEARTRGLLREDELPRQMLNVTPEEEKPRPLEEEDERVS